MEAQVETQLKRPSVLLSHHPPITKYLKGGWSWFKTPLNTQTLWSCPGCLQNERTVALTSKLHQHSDRILRTSLPRARGQFQWPVCHCQRPELIFAAKLFSWNFRVEMSCQVWIWHNALQHILLIWTASRKWHAFFKMLLYQNTEEYLTVICLPLCLLLLNFAISFWLH